MARQPRGTAGWTGRVTRFLAVTIPLCALAAAVVASDALRLSPDVATILGGVTVSDHDVGEDDLAGSLTIVGPAGIPVAADLVAYHREANGDQRPVRPASRHKATADFRRYRASDH